MQTKAPLAALALALAACGSTTPDVPSGPAAVNVPVSGHVAQLPIPPGASGADFSELDVHMFNPASLMVRPKGVSPLASSPLPTGDEACTLQGCPFVVDEVNVANLPMGLVGQVKDAGKALRWAPVYTGMVSPDAAKAASSTRSALENNVIFALSMASQKTVADSLGLTADELTARGLLIGLATAPVAETSPVTHVPAAVPAVKVSATGRNAERVSIVYPNDDYTAASADAGTNRDGIFFVVGAPGGGNPFTTTLVFEDPTKVRQWKNQMAGIGPSFTLITGYPAD